MRSEETRYAADRLFDPPALSANGEPAAPVEEGVRWTPFPTEALPQQVAHYVHAHARALFCDEALIAVPVLLVLGAAVGNSYRIRIKHSWQEPSTLWAVIAMRSGQMKSPALKVAVDPLVSLELEFKDEWDGRMHLYEEEQSNYDQLLRGEKKSASAPVKPTRRRVRVSDTTIESIALLHADNPRGLLLVRDELAGWVGSFDSYKRGTSDLQAWTEMYDGRYVQVDRKSMNPPVLDIRWPAVSVVGTIQPEVLVRKIEEEHIHSGFIPRLLIVSPPERRRTWTDADVTEEVREGYFRLVRQLYSLPFHDEPQVVSLSNAAKDVYTDFYNENAELIHDAQGGTLKSALSKIEAIAARLALSLHLADCAESAASALCSDVSRGSMERATHLARWFRNETIRVYSLFEFDSKSLPRDERLTNELPNEFTYQDVMKHWGVKKRASYDVIKRLIGKGLVEDEGHGKYRRCTMHSLQ